MSSYYKYPRTPHLPWSPGCNPDDIQLTSTAKFDGMQVIITEKLDGENTSMYREHIHARSLDSQHHPSRTWVKAFHAQIAHHIPSGWRLCGENLYARHSLAYEDLASYFYVFSIWNETNICLSWQDTQGWAEQLGLELPLVLYEGLWNEELVKNLSLDLTTQEGYVVRTRDTFAYTDFERNMAKWVRADHVQTDQHWMHAKVTPNKLKKDFS